MSTQELKSRIYQLVDKIDNQSVLEQLLNEANQYVADEAQLQATLEDLTDSQRERLEQAIQQHKEGRTVSHEDMKQRHRQWLTNLAD